MDLVGLILCSTFVSNKVLGMEQNCRSLVLEFVAMGKPFSMDELWTWVGERLPVERHAIEHVVYGLLRKHRLVRVGTGLFLDAGSGKSIFTIELNEQEQELSQMLRMQFPYLTFCIFNGSVLSRLGNNSRVDRMTYVTVERYALDKIYHYLKERYSSVWLDAYGSEAAPPCDRSLGGIVVRALLQKAPTIKKGGQVYPALEQLLVDIRKDALFAHLNPTEADTIWANASDQYYINESRLRYYAKRRKLDLTGKLKRA